jgi:hypothetical protein
MSISCRSIVIEHLLEDENATVVYIYCQYNDQLSTTKILESILKQMVERSDGVAQYVATSLYKKCLRTKTRPSRSELLKALRGAAQKCADLFIVVDALDELRDDVRPEVVRDLVSLEQPLFMTSRPLSDLPSIREPHMLIRAPDQDFLTYITTKISYFPKLDRLLSAPDVRKEIIAKIYSRCDGM